MCKPIVEEGKNANAHENKRITAHITFASLDRNSTESNESIASLEVRINSSRSDFNAMELQEICPQCKCNVDADGIVGYSLSSIIQWHGLASREL